MIRSGLNLQSVKALCRSDCVPQSENRKPVSFGIASIDERLRGGLVRGGLHEVFAGESGEGSAAAFAAMLAERALAAGQAILWIREDRGQRQYGRLYAPGLIELGCDPRRLILVTTADTLGLLRAAADSVKCAELGAVIIEPWGKAPAFDLTASRRLTLAAAVSGVFVLAVRADATPMPSAAHSRWQVSPAPSTALAANAPGHPAFDIALLRHRGGIAGFEARLEWNRDERSFAPLSGAVPAFAAGGADQSRQAA